MGRFTATFSDNDRFQVGFTTGDTLKAGFGDTQVIATGDYDKLKNKPVLNGVTIQGEKGSEDYKLQGAMDEVTAQDIDKIIFGE